MWNNFCYSVMVLFLAVCIHPRSSFAQPSRSGDQVLTGPLLNQAKVKQGETIPADLVVYSETGEQLSLLNVIDEKYTVLVSGCLTCPIFHRTYPGVEAVYQDYKDREDVQFFYLYKSLAHPEYNGYIQPVTLEERLAHIVEAKRVLDTSFNWICDGMDNAARHTLGMGPNTQIIFDPKGKIVHTLGWSDGEQLRQELIKQVGDTKTHSSVRDVNIQKQPPAMAQKDVSASSRRSSLSFDTTMVPVLIKSTGDSKQPLYVKPRVEVSQSVLDRGRGEMYLGFHLDPIHHVHWNNLAAPLQFELDLPDGMYATPKRAEAPKVEADSDAAPREFVIEVTSGAQADAVVGLTFHYFACSDKEGWCVPVTQKYEVALAVDPDGGGVMGRSFNRGGRGQNQRQRQAPGDRGQPPGGRTPEQVTTRILEADNDGDGIVSLDDLPEQMRRGLVRADENQDGVLDTREIDRAAQMMSRGGPGGRPGLGRRQPGGPGGGHGDPVARIRAMDANGDGQITQDEVPEQAQRQFGRMDENGDGVIDANELESLSERFRGGQGQPPRARPPRQSGNDNI